MMQVRSVVDSKGKGLVVVGHRIIKHLFLSDSLNVVGITTRM
jgi:hypothetical protein